MAALLLPTVITVTIAKKQISDVTIILDKNRYPYDNGNEIRPVVTVKYNGGTNTLPDTEYVVRYNNNINVGEDTASVTVTEKTDGNYTFTSTSEKFSIEKINHDAISVSGVAKAGALTCHSIYQMVQILLWVWSQIQIQFWMEHL